MKTKKDYHSTSEAGEILSSLKGKIKKLRQKTDTEQEYLDQLQRLQAEFANYRKRTVKEKEEFRKYLLEDFVYSLLNVVDNMQRAIEASQAKHSYQSLVDGVHLVEKQFSDLLKNVGVALLNVNPGDKFNPHEHHAMSNESSNDYVKDTIIKVTLNGYRIHDRILRPAAVIVSSGPVVDK